jgi:hypothetical protein
MFNTFNEQRPCHRSTVVGSCGHAAPFTPGGMLEQLFGSKTRVRLLRLFLNNHKGAYFVRELTRKIGAQINAVRNELDNLVNMGIISVVEEEQSADAPAGNKKKRRVSQKKFYRLNTEALLYPELKALFTKSRVLLEKDFVKKLAGLGSLAYLALTGVFVGPEPAPTDVFIVGRVNRDKLVSLIKDFEQEVGHEVNYTVMAPQEYKYRRDVTDRFLYSILESKKIVVLDNLEERLPSAGV